MPNKLDDLLHNYDGGGAHNVLDLVFKPCLSECKSYKRTAAEITAGAVANWGYAMLNIIDNHVPIEFLIGNNSEDFPLIKKINDLVDDEEKKREAMQKFIQDKTRILFNLNIDENVSTVIRSLYASGQLTMKAVFHLNDEGKIRLHHQKIGYFDCGENKGIIINGGGNESRNAYLENGENLSVRKEWHESHKEDFNFWKGILDGLEGHPKKLVVEPDRKFVDHLKSLSTLTSRNDLKNSWQRFLDSRDTVTSTPTPSPTTEPTPTPTTEVSPPEWQHQDKAIDTFLHSARNEFSINENLEKRDKKMTKGILSMATGTGKTSTALKIINILIDEKEINKVVIIPPNEGNLCNQWVENVRNWKFRKELKVFEHFGDKRGVESFIDENNLCILIAKRDYELIEYLLSRTSKEDTLIIHDEVHGFGSPGLKRLCKKQNEYKYTLGLSATPERDYDVEGTEFIFEEIGHPIFDYPLEQAIQNGTLCPFDYTEIKVQQSDETTEKIADLQRTYRPQIENATTPSEKEHFRFTLAIQIAACRAADENKIPQLAEFAHNNIHYFKNCIIFCATHQQADEVGDMLSSLGLLFAKIHENYSASEQQGLLNKLADGEIDVIVNCHKLSEGIDIRSLSSIVICSSFRSRRETIQRVGRCVRSDPNNPDKVARVTDLVLYKNIENNNIIESEADRKNWLQKISRVRKNG